MIIQKVKKIDLKLGLKNNIMIDILIDIKINSLSKLKSFYLNNLGS